MRNVTTLLGATWAAVLCVVLSMLMPQGCAAPWETAGKAARTIYAGTLAGALEACRTEWFPVGDPRWATACEHLERLPDQVGAAQDEPQHVRIFEDGEIELQ